MPAASAIGAPPAHLDEAATEEWRRLVAKLPDCDIDPTDLEVRCLALSRLRAATAALGNELTYKHGALLKPRPELAIIADAQRIMRQFDEKYSRARRAKNPPAQPGTTVEE
jgi:phage terminase small subunit